MTYLSNEIIKRVLKKKLNTKVGYWVAQKVKHPSLDFGSGHNLTICETGALSWILHRQHGACLGFSLHLSLPLPDLCFLSLKINKYIKIKHKVAGTLMLYILTQQETNLCLWSN